MKKIGSLFLITIMLFTMSVPCFAMDAKTINAEPGVFVDSFGNATYCELLPVKDDDNQFILNYYLNGALQVTYYMTRGEDKITAIPQGAHERSSINEVYEFNASDHVVLKSRSEREPQEAMTYGTRFGRINYNYCEDANATFYAILMSNSAVTYEDVVEINADRGDRVANIVAAFVSILLGLFVEWGNIEDTANTVVAWVLTNLNVVTVENKVREDVREETECLATEYDISVNMDSDDILSGVVFDTYDTHGYVRRFYYENTLIRTEEDGIIPSKIETWNKRAVALRIWDETILFPANYEFPGFESAVRL